MNYRTSNLTLRRIFNKTRCVTAELEIVRTENYSIDHLNKKLFFYTITFNLIVLFYFYSLLGLHDHSLFEIYLLVIYYSLFDYSLSIIQLFAIYIIPRNRV